MCVRVRVWVAEKSLYSGFCHCHRTFLSFGIIQPFSLQMLKILFEIHFILQWIYSVAHTCKVQIYAFHMMILYSIQLLNAAIRSFWRVLFVLFCALTSFRSINVDLIPIKPRSAFVVAYLVLVCLFVFCLDIYDNCFFFPSRCSESVVHSFPFAHCRISSSQKSLERQHTHESVSMNNDIRWWQFRSSHVKIGITLLYERKGFIFPFNWFELSELNNGCVRSLNSKAFNISYNKCASAIKMHLKCDSSCELTLEPLSNRPTLKLISSIYPFQITAEKKNSRISWIAV